MDRFESKGGAYHDGVNERFRQLARDDPERFLVLDSALGIEKVAELLLRDMEVYLRRRGWAGFSLLTE